MRSVLSANKTPNTNKEEVRDIKSLFVMYYQPSDRLMAYDLFKKFWTLKKKRKKYNALLMDARMHFSEKIFSD